MEQRFEGVRAKWRDSEYLPRIIVEIGALILGLPAVLVWAFGAAGFMIVCALMLILLFGLIIGVAQQNGV